MLAYVVKLSADYSRLKTRLEEAEEDISSTNNSLTKNVEEIKELVDKNDRISSAKFTELFNSRNKTNETLTELTTTLKMLVSNMDKQYEGFEKRFTNIDAQFEKLERKIDSIK